MYCDLSVISIVEFAGQITYNFWNAILRQLELKLVRLYLLCILSAKWAYSTLDSWVRIACYIKIVVTNHYHSNKIKITREPLPTPNMITSTSINTWRDKTSPQSCVLQAVQESEESSLLLSTRFGLVNTRQEKMQELLTLLWLHTVKSSWIVYKWHYQYRGLVNYKLIGI